MLSFSANLRYIFFEYSLPDAIRKSSEAGFDAVECPWPYNTTASEVHKALKETGMKMVVINTLTGGDISKLDKGLAAIPERIEEARRCIDSAVDYAKELTETDFDEAILEAKNVRAILDDIFREVDVILTPSALGEAPKDLTGIPKNNFNNLWTLMYVPCLNLPLFLGPNDLPVGLQIIGPQNEDQNLLKCAHSIDLRIKEYFNKFPINLN